MSTQEVLTVDLDAYRSGGGKVFAGRSRGAFCRRKSGLDGADTVGQHVRVIVPDDVFSINSSFFLGMLGDSIRYHGEERFRELYEFVGKDFSSTVEDGIREALDRSSPLEPKKAMA